MLLCEDRRTTSESRVKMPKSPILRVYEPLSPNLIFGACLLAGFLLATYIGLRDNAFHFILLDICLFFWAISHLRRALNAYRKRSILDVYDTGFACPDRFDGRIAWRDVEAYAATPGESLFLRLRPETADRLQWRGLEARSRNALACRRAPISFFTYYGSERLLEAKRTHGIAHQGRPALGARTKRPIHRLHGEIFSNRASDLARAHHFHPGRLVGVRDGITKLRKISYRPPRNSAALLALVIPTERIRNLANSESWSEMRPQKPVNFCENRANCTRRALGAAVTVEGSAAVASEKFGKP